MSRGYPGGKGGAGVHQRIISLQPPHRVYLEPFLGGGTVMRKKRPALENVGVDLDPSVTAMAAALAARGEWVPGVAAGTGAEGGAGPMFTFHTGDALEHLQARRCGPADLVYCDPPYLRETRSCQRSMYRYELDRAGHERLLDLLLRLPCMVQISGYASELYRQRLRDWTEVRYQVVVRSSAVRTECLWMNYQSPVELHDYRYLGEGYRERERIRRKQRRWRARLEAMEPQERQALLSELAAMRPGHCGP